ncbi:hypothetical protein SAMN04487912_105190 [Arthrobacter sp. cf158]|uniref:hypothetical protein n=1 Tax=Arthrobacter sp. cf158 TaxID=1761744 RepID=UPI00089991A2|nr:hypothetical protein [Arthrobacter sp. cf158]SDW87697.1 hypothetical protein SAMN04487912_105190 [Arthrobacter sp. cf158]
MSDYELPDAFYRFFDDAAVFPPGLAPLEVAVKDYVVRRDSVLGVAIGPLVLPLQDMPKAEEILVGWGFKGASIEVSVVVPPGQLEAALTAAHAPGPLTIVSVELKTGPLQEDWKKELFGAATLAGECDVYVELTASQIGQDALELIVKAGARLKYRTGGITADLFPTAEQLAFVIGAAVELAVPFKLTAGLHRAVRYTDQETGFTHHGFLNIAMATALAYEAEPTASLIAVLREQRPAVLAEMYNAHSSRWRQGFSSFGTCSVTEPLKTLEELDILPAGASAISLSLLKAIQS